MDNYIKDVSYKIFELRDFAKRNGDIQSYEVYKKMLKQLERYSNSSFLLAKSAYYKQFYTTK